MQPNLSLSNRLGLQGVIRMASPIRSRACSISLKVTTSGAALISSSSATAIFPRILSPALRLVNAASSPRRRS